MVWKPRGGGANLGARQASVGGDPSLEAKSKCWKMSRKGRRGQKGDRVQAEKEAPTNLDPLLKL